MLLNPEVQTKAQAEVDLLLGSGPDRLPTLADRTQLPYVEACLKECLRWHPPAPGSLAHLVRSDQDFKGYHIPKGTVVVPNIW
jgi:cytochrome P450